MQDPMTAKKPKPAKAKPGGSSRTTKEHPPTSSKIIDSARRYKKLP